MSEISMDNKLQLVGQIRSRYEQDQSDLFHREQILYGQYKKPDTEEEIIHLSSRIRLIIAAALTALLVTCDNMHLQIGSYDTETIFTMISYDVGTELDHILETSGLLTP